MSADLTALESWVAPLLQALTPGARAALAGRVARDLRRSQLARIKGQTNPDGSAYAPRIPQSRRRTGTIRRGALFKKIGGFARASADADSAGVLFSGRVGRIALVHQSGLVDQVRQDGPVHQYTRRELLGFSPDDVAAVRAGVLTHLGAN